MAVQLPTGFSFQMIGQRPAGRCGQINCPRKKADVKSGAFVGIHGHLLGGFFKYLLCRWLLTCHVVMSFGRSAYSMIGES